MEDCSESDGNRGSRRRTSVERTNKNITFENLTLSENTTENERQLSESGESI